MRDTGHKDAWRLITSGEAAAHCHVSLPAVRRWIREGRLKAFRTPGKHARIEIEEFQRFRNEYGMPPYPRAEAIPRPCVLVVEDNPDVLQILAGILAAHPLSPTVETAVDGYEAMIKLGIFKPSFLILDVVMPWLDGLEVCRRLRASAATRDIRILAVTGHADMVESVIAAGADSWVTKPCEFEAMNTELERFLSAPDRDLLTAVPGR